MSMNPLVNFLKKSPKEFTKSDIMKYVEENEIRMINFHYVAGDGRIKPWDSCCTVVSIWTRFSPTASAWTVPTSSRLSFTPVLRICM